jgi:C4-dicarboxylate-specific signal transduction histidine kinase
MNQTKNQAVNQGKQQIPREPSPVYSDPPQFKKYFDRLSALAMIGKITPEVIHDINNYLTGILGYAELLSMKKIEDESIKNGLKNISFSAEKCKVLLANIMSLSRREPSLVRFGDVNEIIEKTIELRRCALRHQQIQLTMDLGSNIPSLAVDGVNLQKALLNLMFKAEEALEQRPEGRKIIFKSLFDSLKNTVVITISANGFGMPPDHLARIFELFPTDESIEPENGFALQEAMQWISEMEGSLIIEPITGEGPVFEVRLPVKGRD